MILGYVRVSSDKQDLQQQKHTILEFAQKGRFFVDRFVEIEASTKRNQNQRKIDELLEILHEGDELITVELSRLGRNMLEVLNLLEAFDAKGVTVTFVRQQELSTGNKNPHSKLLRAIYSYFAEAEREFISQRTKSGLEAARAKGVQLGRRKGSKNKERKLDKWRDLIKEFLNMGQSIASIQKAINYKNRDEAVSYNTVKYYIRQDAELKRAMENHKPGSLLCGV